jgi:acetate kinase
MTDEAMAADKVPGAMEAILVAADWLRCNLAVMPVGIGHRVVHGGPDYDRPILVREPVLNKLASYESLAPLHQPANLAPIRALLKSRPETPQVACFDTAFHRSHGPLADRYAIPARFYAEGIRRYGFHGLSYEYVSGRLREIAPDIADKRVIIAHLGSGASMCGLLGGRSIETTMGFTALDGLPMGTRPGQLDAGIILYLLTQKGMDAKAIERLLYHECGLRALSGISNDVRDLEACNDPDAVLALEYFAYRVASYTGMLAAALGGIDAFVFTGGIGENSSKMRARITDRLSWLGFTLDRTANNGQKSIISSTSGKVEVFVVPTDEEFMIAKHTLAVLSADCLVRPESVAVK